MSLSQGVGGQTPVGLSSKTLDAGAALQEAERLRRAGELTRAQRICEKLLGQFPDYVSAHQLLATILIQAKQDKLAVIPAMHAAMHSPRDWYSAWLVGAIYSRLGANDMAIRSLQRSLELRPDEVGTLVALGNAYSDDRAYGKAVDMFRRALTIDSSSNDARNGLSSALMHLGQAPEAVSLLVETLQPGSAPPSVRTLYALSQLPSSLHRVDILGLVDSCTPGSDPEDFNAMVAFTKGAALHNAGRHAEAWKQLAAGNAMVYPAYREEARGRARNYEGFLAEVRKSAVLEPSEAPAGAPLALFIMGPSTSGKSTLERLVGTLPGVKLGFESLLIREATRFAFQLGGLPPRRDLHRLPPWFNDNARNVLQDALKYRAEGADVLTITNPGVVSDLYRFAELVPNSRFVFVRRNADDVAFRIFVKKYKKANSYAYSIHTIRNFINWYHAMMDALVEKLPGRSIVVRYEDMVEDPRAAVAAVAKLCGLPEPTGDVGTVGDDRGCSEPYRKWMEEARLAG